MPEMLFTEFPPVSYEDWLAQAGEVRGKVMWGPQDLPGETSAQPWPAREWEMLETAPDGLVALPETGGPVTQLRAALASEEASAFLVPVDTMYFEEIAKFRALRRLFDREIRLVAITGMQHQTIYDPHVNVLRATTCAMSAIAGGCDALVVRPFDEVRGESSELAKRLARNTHHLLREESGFGIESDPAAGSWYIESLTQQYVEAARATDAAHDAPPRRALVGTTKYADPREKAGVSTVSEGRIATEFEVVRLAVERSGREPKIRLLTGEDRKMSRARAEFARGVFASGGFSTAEPADFVVLCGADAEYPSMAAAAKGSLPVIVAGPATEGAFDFVNMKSDIPAKLRAWCSHLGIEVRQ